WRRGRPVRQLACPCLHKHEACPHFSRQLEFVMSARRAIVRRPLLHAVRISTSSTGRIPVREYSRTWQSPEILREKRRRFFCEITLLPQRLDFPPEPSHAGEGHAFLNGRLADLVLCANPRPPPRLVRPHSNSRPICVSVT